jgi:hypothetical protein
MDTAVKIILGMLALSVCLAIGFLYVVIHFIAKFW